MENKEAFYINEIKRLKSLHQNEDFLPVIILSIQLCASIINHVSSYWDYWIERKVTSKLPKEERAVYQLMDKLYKKDSDRLYVANGLVAMFESDHWPKESAFENFRSSFSKLENLVSLRNTFAHEFYEKTVPLNRVKDCSNAAIELLDLFATQLEQLWSSPDESSKSHTNSRRHTFAFEGGEQLTTIGATFFVSYLYYRHVDSTHRNWDSIKTHKSRINTINRSESYYQVWLSHIGSMSDTNLNKNTLGLNGVTVKNMALAIQKVL